MTEIPPSSEYALGYADAEHERLIRQAANLAPFTERIFREAGIGPGQRVLDIGSGMGDVAMLAARIVGPTGEVTGVERDSRSIAKARSRVVESGLINVTITQSDVGDVTADKPFDAVVGRYILMYLSDPVAVLRSLLRLVRPGGAVAFLDVSWSAVIAVASGLPLWKATESLILEAFQRSGGNPEMGLELHGVFVEAGLPAPKMHMEILMGSDAGFVRNLHELFMTLLPKMQTLGLDLTKAGDPESLAQRLLAELTESKRVAAWPSLVSAWAHKPMG